MSSNPHSWEENPDYDNDEDYDGPDGYEDDDAEYEEDDVEYDYYPRGQQQPQQYQQPEGYSASNQGGAGPPTSDLEGDDEDVEALADALELNKKLKSIVSSGLDPETMQAELTKLMGSMSLQQQRQQTQHEEAERERERERGPDPFNPAGRRRNRAAPSHNQSRTVRMKKASKESTSVHRPPKGANFGKTFSDHEQAVMAKNNRRLLEKMIKIQSGTGSTNIGGYSTSVGRGSSVGKVRSSHQINRMKKSAAISSSNAKFLQRLQNVKSTMNTKKMRADADRNAKISAMRRQIPSHANASSARRGAAPGAGNVYGKAANESRLKKFRRPPTLNQPDWES